MVASTSPVAARRAYEYVKKAILSREYDGGALLTEGEIAARVGVSRTPVREALLRLEAEGLVALYPKKGALVRPVSAQEIEDVIEARLMVEVFAAERAWAQRAELLRRLGPQLEEMRMHAAAGDPAALMAADRAFHAMIIDAAGNRILSQLYDSLRDRQMRMGVALMRVAPERMGAVVGEHAALVDALLGEDAEHFRALVRDHVTSAGDKLRTMR